VEAKVSVQDLQQSRSMFVGLSEKT